MAIAKVNDVPKLQELKELLRSIAMLDAVLAHDLGETVYSFNDKWSSKVSVGIVKNGQGDDLFVVFDSSGCFMKGLVHDIPLAGDSETLNRLRESIPETFKHHLAEPAFTCNEGTFFAWCDSEESGWNSTTELVVDSDDGSGYLLNFLKLTPASFQEWAEENYETDIEIKAVASIYESVPLTNELVKNLNGNLSLGVIRQVAAKIGYPITAD